MLEFHSSERDGAEGAERKAWLLNRESGYNIVSIEHRSMPVKDIPSEAYNPRWGRSQLVYIIRAEKPLFPKFFSKFIPDIIEA